MAEKARYWVGVAYPENMIDDWQDEIGRILQVPYAYCLHDKCADVVSAKRKPHVHIMVAYGNTTTYNSIVNLLNKLSKPNMRAVNMVQQVYHVRNMYEYLIHNTEDCKKKGKYLYDEQCRVTGNGFDIGSYEQLSLADKQRIKTELIDFILDNNFLTYGDFYLCVRDGFSKDYMTVLLENTGTLKEFVKSNYFKFKMVHDGLVKEDEVPCEVLDETEEEQ